MKKRPVAGAHVAVCPAGTRGQMEDNIRNRAIRGAGVHSGPVLEYWKKKSDAQ